MADPILSAAPYKVFLLGQSLPLPYGSWRLCLSKTLDFENFATASWSWYQENSLMVVC